MKAYIKSLAYNLPEKILDNEQVAAMFPEWTVEKIEKKIGIKERHITADGETASDLAVGAAEKLFAANNIDRETIDYLIFVTQSPDYHLPTTACLIQTRLGLSKKITAIDVNLGCSGFVTGLSLAKAVVVSGQAKNVLLLTAETYSKYMHERDKSNRTIFGDGSAATLVSTEGMAEIGEFVIGTDGTGAENLIVKSGGARNPKPLNDLVFDEFGNPRSSDNLYMDGPAILNYSLESIPQLFNDVLEKNGLTKDDIDLHVYHQANIFLANLERRKLKIDKEKYYCNIEHVGNTVSSTIPIGLCLALEDGSLKPGMKVLSVAQGLGYTWGGMVLYFKKMLKIKRFVNELMTSNCYVVYDEDTKRCLVIDPGSEKSLREIEFIEKNNLTLDYIIITHEHTDHNWGVNTLREHFENSKLLCSEECSKHVKKANRAYFLLYYDDPNYRYEIAPADKFVSDGECMEWSGHQIKFIFTPGHSYGSVCIDIDGRLFTGDTIMPYKPYFNGRDSNQDDWDISIRRIKDAYSPNTVIFPGHGDELTLSEWAETKY